MYTGPKIVYTFIVDESPVARIVWDEHNLNHLLVARVERGISSEDVEHLLMDAETVVRRLESGADLNIGRAPNGRPLAVITIGVAELYPKTAWWVSERVWRRAHE